MIPMDHVYAELERTDLEEDFQLRRIGFFTYLWRLWKL